MSDTLKDKIGIYQIVNLIDGKKYIGSSKNLYNRKSKHIYTLRTNSHRNCYLQRAFNKYGEANFSFEVIEFINTEEELLPREQYYIELYQVCDRDKGYNLVVDATRNILSDEILVKIKENNTGCKNPMYGKNHSLETKLRISNINKGKTFSKEQCKKLSLAHKGKNNSSYSKTGALNSNSKKVICIETGVIYNCMLEASRINNISYGGISECCRGNRNTVGGYHWEFYKPKSNKVICLDTNIIYDSANMASKETSIPVGNIIKVCNNERFTAGGYRWEYYQE